MSLKAWTYTDNVADVLDILSENIQTVNTF